MMLVSRVCHRSIDTHSFTEEGGEFGQCMKSTFPNYNKP